MPGGGSSIKIKERKCYKVSLRWASREGSRFVGKVMTPVVFFPDSTLKGAKIILAISDC